MRLRASVILAVPALLLGVAAAPAAAKGPVMELAGTQSFAGAKVLLSGSKLAVRSTAPGAVPGSTVEITWKVNGKQARRVRRPIADGQQTFDSLRVDLPGSVTVQGRLRGPDAKDAGTSPALRATALLPYAANGARGLRVRFLQAHLAALGYQVPVNGSFDVKTQFAVIAWHKVNHRTRTSVADTFLFRAVVAGRGAYAARFPREGRHVEFDRGRQVLALVNPGGRVFRVFHSSSGRPRLRTPLGNFRFWRKERGLNDRGMLNSVYFTHDKTTKPTRPACAVHGYFAVPTYAYSHCCLRVGLWDALFIYRWIHLGERVHIYV